LLSIKCKGYIAYNIIKNPLIENKVDSKTSELNFFFIKPATAMIKQSAGAIYQSLPIENIVLDNTGTPP
jgi:hypothetical protein